MFFKILNIKFLIFFTIYLTFNSIASSNDDCKNSSFYVKNIKVDLTKESIIKARKLAEDKARNIGFKRLLNKLTLKNKKLSFKKSDILLLVDYLKINDEANSDKRYLADFDICFNRSLVIDYFHKNKLQYAETYRKPITILPIFIGPRGFILLDDNDVWYSKWKKKLAISDGLVKLVIAKKDLNLSRKIGPKIVSQPQTNLIKKIINKENSDALLIVVAEPILRNDGKTFLNVYAQIFDGNGKFVNTIYRNKLQLPSTTSIYNIDDNLFNLEVLNIIDTIDISWKKDNLIDPSIYNEIDLLIPISSMNSTVLELPLLFNDKIIKVKSTKGFLDKGIIEIEKELIFYGKKTLKSFRSLNRGLLKSTKNLEYKSNIKVTQKNIKIWPFILKTLQNLPFVKEVKVISISNLEGRVIVKFIGNKKTFFQAVSEKKISFKNFNNKQYILTF